MENEQSHVVSSVEENLDNASCCFSESYQSCFSAIEDGYEEISVEGELLKERHQAQDSDQQDSDVEEIQSQSTYPSEYFQFNQETRIQPVRKFKISQIYNFNPEATLKFRVVHPNQFFSRLYKNLLNNSHGNFNDWIMVEEYAASSPRRLPSPNCQGYCSVVKSGPQYNKICSICTESMTETDRTLSFEPCQHAFHKYCVYQILLTKLSEEDMLVVPCPDCQLQKKLTLLSEYQIDYLLCSDFDVDTKSTQIVESHNQDYVHSHYYDQNDYADNDDIPKDGVYCPNPACDKIITILPVSEQQVNSNQKCIKTVECECGSVFCSECLQDEHWPLSCEQFKIFNGLKIDLENDLMLQTQMQLFYSIRKRLKRGYTFREILMSDFMDDEIKKSNIGFREALLQYDLLYPTYSYGTSQFGGLENQYRSNSRYQQFPIADNTQNIDTKNKYFPYQQAIDMVDSMIQQYRQSHVQAFGDKDAFRQEIIKNNNDRNSNSQNIDTKIKDLSDQLAINTVDSMMSDLQYYRLSPSQASDEEQPGKDPFRQDFIKNNNDRNCNTQNIDTKMKDLSDQLAIDTVDSMMSDLQQYRLSPSQASDEEQPGKDPFRQDIIKNSIDTDSHIDPTINFESSVRSMNPGCMSPFSVKDIASEGDDEGDAGNQNVDKSNQILDQTEVKDVNSAAKNVFNGITIGGQQDCYKVDNLRTMISQNMSRLSSSVVNDLAAIRSDSGDFIMENGDKNKSGQDGGDDNKCSEDINYNSTSQQSHCIRGVDIKDAKQLENVQESLPMVFDMESETDGFEIVTSKVDEELQPSISRPKIWSHLGSTLQFLHCGYFETGTQQVEQKEHSTQPNHTTPAESTTQQGVQIVEVDMPTEHPISQHTEDAIKVTSKQVYAPQNQDVVKVASKQIYAPEQAEVVRKDREVVPSSSHQVAQDQSGVFRENFQNEWGRPADDRVPSYRQPSQVQYRTSYYSNRGYAYPQSNEQDFLLQNQLADQIISRKIFIIEQSLFQWLGGRTVVKISDVGQKLYEKIWYFERQHNQVNLIVHGKQINSFDVDLQQQVRNCCKLLRNATIFQFFNEIGVAQKSQNALDFELVVRDDDKEESGDLGTQQVLSLANFQLEKLQNQIKKYLPLLEKAVDIIDEYDCDDPKQANDLYEFYEMSEELSPLLKNYTQNYISHILNYEELTTN